MAHKRQRVHIRSVVNAANVSKAGSTYTVRDVCGAVDDLVMNGMLYGGDQLAAGAASLEGRPAPAGHPKDGQGRYISALSGNALLTAYAGAVCTNARHEGGRTLVDVVINEAQARAHPDGAKLIERLDAAINGVNADPIHVSTGVLVQAIAANGESRGKKYSRIATNLQYDHLAFLLHESGAGTPADGVGMFVNSDGTEAEIEAVTVNTDPEDRRGDGALAWARQQLRRLLGNKGDDLSFDAISSALHQGLPDGSWLREVFDRYAVWTDRDGKLYRQDYTVSSDGSVAWAGTAVEVTRKVSYEEVFNHQRQEHDPVKPLILAALNAAGVSTEGLDDAAILAAYNKLAAQPAETKLTAANSKLAELEANAQAAEKAELDTLAGKLATNSKAGLTADDFKAMGLKRCRELAANATGTTGTAAPVTPGGSGEGATNELATYSLNAHLDDKKAA
ncbi:hypothetical protein [Aquabacterium sp. OR-4]|uniref:hypothetical protein n=1 Tax=Aquabacterium sp. OR-4 TaxID=2978127 RepID=UPI0021B3D78F|nr:hypothetical protein [Aquabacterium sp. OR-4]MDT7834971.1 hypothetical protein [Aquabacterium sp. OR-4]